MECYRNSLDQFTVYFSLHGLADIAHCWLHHVKYNGCLCIIVGFLESTSTSKYLRNKINALDTRFNMMPNLWNWICFLVWEGINAKILNISAKVGHNVELPCHTSFDEPVDWRYQKDEATNEDYVCTAVEPLDEGVTFCENYIRWPKISVNLSIPGDFTLKVCNVAVSDSGLYHCVEEGGAGTRHTYRLTVSVPECDSSPCQNNGTCTVGDNSYTCVCAAGFTGTNCETDVDECLSEPCKYGGFCRQEVNNYTCDCPLGFAGINCETDVDECSSKPCQYGGFCRQGFNSYTCDCLLGFAGINCETVVKRHNISRSAITGIIVGIVVALSVIFIVIVVVVCLRQRKRHARRNQNGNDEVVPLGSKGDATVEVIDRPWLPPIQCLPLKLSEALLMSSARQLAKTYPRPDVETCVTLASVCKLFHIIIKRKFARTLKQYLTTVFRPYRLSLGPQQWRMTLPGQNQVRSVARIDHELYVVNKSDEVDVYTVQPPSSSQRPSIIHVSGHIAACHINNCLYVADWRSCIWKVETNHKVDKWLDVSEDVQSLSVNSDGHIVMLIIEGGWWIRFGKVNVFSADGVQLLSLALPRAIIEPHHVVQTVNKSFIVCHGFSRTGLHRVCEVNDAGVLVKSYGGSRGSGLRQLDRPEHIALDTEERIFVADFYNGRVLMLDKQLHIQRTLLTWSRDRPWRLIYDRETTQLTVLLKSDEEDVVEIYTLL